MTALDALRREEEAAIKVGLERPIPRDGFWQAIRHNVLLIERALRGNLIIPDFASFCEEFDRIHAIAGENRGVAAVIQLPQLDIMEPALDRWGADVCLIDELGYDGWVGAEYQPSGKTEASLGWLNEFG